MNWHGKRDSSTPSPLPNCGGDAVCSGFLRTWSGPWNPQRYIGTVLMVVGLSFIGVARYQLGRSFSVKAEAHHLVTTGLYSKIRNPIYTFGIVMIAGMILILQRPEGWLVVVAAIDRSDDSRPTRGARAGSGIRGRSTGSTAAERGSKGNGLCREVERGRNISPMKKLSRIPPPGAVRRLPAGGRSTEDPAYARRACEQRSGIAQEWH